MSGSIGSHLDRTADALLQQKAIQSSQHERLEGDLTRLVSQLRSSMQSIRNVSGDVSRYREDVHDLQQETLELDRSLQSKHKLRLQMLSSLGDERSTELVKKLGDAPLLWAGVPQNLLRLNHDMSELALLRDAQRTAVAAAQALSVPFVAAQQCMWWRAALYVLQSHRSTVTQTHEHVRNATAVIEGDRAQAQQTAAELQQSLLELDERHRVLASEMECERLRCDEAAQDERAIAQAAMELDVTHSALQASQSSHQVTLSQASAEHHGLWLPTRDAADSFLVACIASAAELAHEVAVFMQDAKERWRQVRTKKVAMHEALQARKVRVVTLKATQQSAAVTSRIVGVLHTTLLYETQAFKRDRDSIEATRQRIASMHESIQAQRDKLASIETRKARLASIQMAMTSLLVVELPELRARVEAEFTEAFEQLMEDQLHAVSELIQQTATRQEAERVAAAEIAEAMRAAEVVTIPVPAETQKHDETVQASNQPHPHLCAVVPESDNNQKHRSTVVHSVSRVTPPKRIESKREPPASQLTRRNLTNAVSAAQKVATLRGRHPSLAMSVWSAENGVRGAQSPSPVPRQPEGPTVHAKPLWVHPSGLPSAQHSTHRPTTAMPVPVATTQWLPAVSRREACGLLPSYLDPIVELRDDDDDPVTSSKVPVVVQRAKPTPTETVKGSQAFVAPPRAARTKNIGSGSQVIAAESQRSMHTSHPSKTTAAIRKPLGVVPPSSQSTGNRRTVPKATQQTQQRDEFDVFAL